MFIETQKLLLLNSNRDLYGSEEQAERGIAERYWS
jgi:hypothetical protein